MHPLHWLNRAIRRFNRKAEDTALAASVVQAEGTAGTQTSAVGTKTVLGEIEKAEDRETP